MTNPDTARKKAYVETYGCQMNVSDGELMQGVLAAGGYDIVARPEDADVVLVNTCAIREHAEQRVIGRVGELNRLKAAHPGLVIGVTGCMAQRLGEQLLDQASHVDLVMGPDGYRSLPAALGAIRPDHPASPVGVAASRRLPLPVLGSPTVPMSTTAAHPMATPDGDRTGAAPVADPAADRLAVLDFRGDENYEGLEVRRSSAISAWVPVQRGCNYRCTYCIVPYVRGSEKNRAPVQILEEVRGIAAKGITEVTLLGQTVNSWRHADWSFPRLLREVARVDGIRRVRFTSPHPNDVTPELVEVMATEPGVCGQLHLPVQSGHDRTLKRMLRRYTVAGYMEKVRLIREAIPGIALSTDVIVAFPGETDDEYEATLDLMREVRYDDAFLYKYSPRDGTPATRLPAGQFVAPDVAQARLQRLIDLHRAIQAEVNAAEVGGVVEVLVERAARSPGDMLGRADSFKVVAFPGGSDLVGRYVRVRLTGTTGATFRGVVVDQPARSVA
ncbi:MAG TPA: MiaB/RimO family radical SAM methylthiotransferase [Longimicrobiales bacterium]|nr:MiaB/RimO family radical SAM methylthiotransferase [Longimicrobiales bacterium]